MNINRLIYPGFWFGKTRREDALELSRRGVGGFCIYGGTRESLRELIADLKNASPLPHLFICADYEDGLGKWIKEEDWTLSNMAIGANGSEEAAYQKGLTLAREAREVGVDWIFAPVLDLCDEPKNPIVNTRSFGADPQTVGQLGTALCRGLTDGGVLNSIKHFPGHGRTVQDSHLALPALLQTEEDLLQNELIPFRAALPYADSVMIGHLLFPALDKQNPASLSRAVIADLLKQKLGFNGLVFTDALCMKAIGDEKQAALQALHAGAHILLAAEDSLALSDFLQKQNGLEEFVCASAALQDHVVAKLSAPHKEALPAAKFNQKYAASCAVWHGVPLTLKPGEKVHYLELGNEEDLTAQDFLRALTDAGIEIKGLRENADTVIAVSFSNYKAFKGHINLSEEELHTLASACAAHKQTVFVSFGSPFGTENIAGLTARLFLFTPARQAQVCAAQILFGQKKATGTMPV